MKTAQEIIEQIEAAATTHTPEIRRVATMQPGEAVRQGDVYLTRIQSPLAGEPYPTRQLAPGTTKGSRHIVSAKTDCAIVIPPGGGPLDGPCIDARSRLVVEHPEHGWLDLPPGAYRVTYQRDYARERAEEVRRVAD
jgi:hypothetical protein